MVQSLKVDIVKDLKARLSDAKAIVLVDYKGIDTDEVFQLRNRYREASVDYFVQKNTLVKIALNELGITALDEHLLGPTAVAVCKTDEVAPASVMAKFTKEVMEEKPFPKFKAGIVDGEFYDVEGLEKLSQVPSRETLLARMMGSLQSPISSFVRLIDAIAKKDAEENK